MKQFRVSRQENVRGLVSGDPNPLRNILLLRVGTVTFYRAKKKNPKKIHSENFFFLNLIKYTGNQIVFTIFRLIWIQTDFHLDPNQSENGKYNLISGRFNKISKKNSLCVASAVRETSVSRQNECPIKASP